MTRISSITEHWPSPRERLLLRAALLDGRAALEAWSHWKEVPGNTAEPSAAAALRPLLYRKLSRLGVGDPLVASWEPAYRRTLLRNQLMLQEAAPLIRSLEDAGIETLLLKGAALILRYYEDSGLRPMADLDVMVRKEQARPAFEQLAKLGWVSLQHPDPTTLAAAHSAPLARPGASPLDLHWRLLEDEAPGLGDEALWARAAPVELFGVPTLTLCATDQLLHVLAHGARWSANRSHRWLADASLLLSRAKGEIDWEQLAADARQRRVSLALREGLDFLSTFLDAPVPRETLGKLSAAPVGRLERWEHEAKTRSPERRGPLLMGALHYRSYRRLVNGGVLVPGLRGFLEAVGREWGGVSSWRVPLLTLGKGLRRTAQLAAGWLRKRGH